VPERVGHYFGLDGALVHLTKPDGQIGYVEAQFGGRVIEEPADVADLRVRFDQIRGRALSEDASYAVIRKAMEKMSDDPVADE
jgi:hypothetical protein